jgi:hypothetical protein
MQFGSNECSVYALYPGDEKIQMFSACGMRLRIIHGLFDG